MLLQRNMLISLAPRPFDLGNNIGHPILDGTMHQELKDAIVKVQDVAKQHNKSTGIYATSGNQAREFADQGFHMVTSIEIYYFCQL